MRSPLLIFHGKGTGALCDFLLVVSAINEADLFIDH